MKVHTWKKNVNVPPGSLHFPPFLIFILKGRREFWASHHCFYEKMDENIYRSAAIRSEKCVFPEMQPSKFQNNRGTV